MIWSRGEVLPDEALAIPATDRTFEHGLGLFETLRTWNGRPVLLGRHLARLAASAAALGIPIGRDALPDADAVGLLVGATREDVLVRITLSGGTSAEGGSTLWMRASPLPPPSWSGSARVALGRGPMAQSSGALHRHKTLNYLARRMAYEEARGLGFDEVLLNSGGHPVEGSRTNLFCVVGGRLATPSAETCCLVPGIMRGLVLDLARGLGPVAETAEPLTERTLLLADEVFLTNAIRGIIPVRSVVDPGLSQDPPPIKEAPGPWTRRLQESLESWLSGGKEAP